MIKPHRIQKFWDKVNKQPNGCWLYTGARLKDRNGNQWHGLFDKMLAHRLSWELSNGPIPGKMCVLHKCDVPECVNPNHLFLGTRADNVADMVSKGRQDKRKGESQSCTVLNETQVLEIRESTMKQCDLAKKYKVHTTTINDIIHRRTWKHI